MKKKILSLLVAFSMVFTMMPAAVAAETAVRSADGIAINEANFPDANFRTAVKDFDKDSSDSLSAEEVAAATTLNVSEKSITSLKGIEYLTALENLDFSMNGGLTSVDLSKNTALTTLKGWSCGLNTLDLTQNTKLTTVNIAANPWAAVHVPEKNVSQWEITGTAATTWITDLSWLTLADYGINADKITNLQGGTIRDGMLIPNSTYMYTVQYTYKCNTSGKNIPCKIKFNGREQAPNSGANAGTGTNAGTDTSTGSDTASNGTAAAKAAAKAAMDKGKITLKAKATSYNKVKLTWNAVEKADKYQIYRKAGTGSYKKVATVTGKTYTDKKLNTGTKYSYKVRAFKTAGGTTYYSKYSAVKSAKPVLAKVTSVKAKAGKKNATITWKKVDGANGYKIYRATKKNGKYKAVKTISKQKTVKFTNKKLTKGKTYYYKVRAYKKVNGKTVYGNYSGVVKVKVK